MCPYTECGLGFASAKIMVGNTLHRSTNGGRTFFLHGEKRTLVTKQHLLLQLFVKLLNNGTVLSISYKIDISGVHMQCALHCPM